MQKNDCEMVAKGLCLGCTGLVEYNWVGKYKCKIYNELRNSSKYGKQMGIYDAR